MRKGAKILIVLLFLVSIGLISYPFISNYLYEEKAHGIIETVETNSEGNSEENQKEIEKAKEYNQKLKDANVQLVDPFIADTVEEKNDKYSSMLNIDGSDIMGIIEIPGINVKLPIYHGTSSETLEKGVGHMQGSSLPVGGESTHCVLTGHTGLSRAKLFTDLTKMVKGDHFFLKVYGETLAYKVDQILVVTPDDISNLKIENGKDYCTLLTCTPYGVNTHRLLVRGIRTEYTEEVKEESYNDESKNNIPSKWMQEYIKAVSISSAAFAGFMTVLLIVRVTKNKKTNKVKKQKTEKLKEKRKDTTNSC